MPINMKLGLGVNSGGKAYTFQTETKTLLAALTGTYSLARKKAIDQMIKSLKSAGVWAKLDVLQIYAAPTAADAVVNWKNPGTFNATLVNSPTLEVDRGITGDGASSYIKSNFIPSTNGVNFSKDSAGFHIGIKTDDDSTVTDLGVRDPDNVVRFMARYSGNSIFNINQTSSSIITMVVSSAGFFSVCRTAANSIYRRRNKVAAGAGTEASSALPSKEIFIAAYNNAGSPIQYSARQYVFFALSAGLSTSESDTFADALETYLDYIGAGVI